MKEVFKKFAHGMIIGLGIAFSIVVVSAVAMLNYSVPVATVAGWSGLTATEWNKMVGNFVSLDTQLTTVSSAIVPGGAVMAFNLTGCPDGWSEADGNNWRIDLRGEFIRGWDHGRGVNNWRNLASFEASTSFPILSVYANSPTSGLLVSHTINSNSWYPNDSAATDRDSTSLGAAGQYMSVNLTPSGWTTSARFTARPRNVALLYCIKN